MKIELKVSKAAVLKEVAQTTAYIGGKMEDDEKAYDRISVVDEDAAELQRFWDESRAEVARAMMCVMAEEGMVEEDYVLTIEGSVQFDEAQKPSMELGLFSYFVQSIVAKWCMYANKKEAEAYATLANEQLAEVREKAMYRKRPTRESGANGLNGQSGGTGLHRYTDNSGKPNCTVLLDKSGEIGYSGVMGCCGVQEERRTVLLRMMRSELLYDIGNGAYVEADVMRDAGKVRDNTHARHTTAGIGEKGNVDRVSRMLTAVSREVEELLYPMTKREVEEEVIDNVLEEPEAYEIVLSVPKSMSHTTLRWLSSQVHEYMVARVLADWLSVTNTEAAAIWEQKAEVAKWEIEKAKGHSRKPLTRKISVF